MLKNQLRTAALLLTLFGATISYGQLNLSNKVFEAGSEKHFVGGRNCQFLFLCDCCKTKILFTSAEEYMQIHYCASDFIITQGNYHIIGRTLTLESDGSILDVQKRYNSESYFVQKPTTDKVEISFKIDRCYEILLTTERNDKTFIAIETDLNLGDELDILKGYSLEDYLKLDTFD